MISFNYATNFILDNEIELSNWIAFAIGSEGFNLGAVDYVFCDDEYLVSLNQQFLKHDTLTDIISFDYSVGKQVNGEIYISVERVHENAIDFDTEFYEELYRVMIHGVLHYCGYKDKSIDEIEQMRNKEDFYIDKRKNF